MPQAFYKTITKWNPAFIKFPVAKFIKFRRCNSNLSLPAQAKSPIFHSYVTFRLTLNKCLHLNAMISAYRVFSRLHLITNFLSFLPRNDIPQNAFHSRNHELKTTICSHENPRLQSNNELRTFCVTRKAVKRNCLKLYQVYRFSDSFLS